MERDVPLDFTRVIRTAIRSSYNKQSKLPPEALDILWKSVTDLVKRTDEIYFGNWGIIQDPVEEFHYLDSIMEDGRTGLVTGWRQKLQEMGAGKQNAGRRIRSSYLRAVYMMQDSFKTEGNLNRLKTKQ